VDAQQLREYQRDGLIVCDDPLPCTQPDLDQALAWYGETIRGNYGITSEWRIGSDGVLRSVRSIRKPKPDGAA
jgi:hypothetical protein